jgi:hypothetical protein
VLKTKQTQRKIDVKIPQSLHSHPFSFVS